MNRSFVFVALGTIAALAASASAQHGHRKAVPHPDNPVLRAEHLEMLELVPDSAVTHTAVRDGYWADKSTWKDGALPANDANVLIPAGTRVMLGHVDAAK